MKVIGESHWFFFDQIMLKAVESNWTERLSPHSAKSTDSGSAVSCHIHRANFCSE